ncbi:MAG: (Fe-S)-binding protein, partial [Desulfovibrio sp.]|nr:(Fe-S)-binding protein [Desulfovibrio sp.]
DVDGAMILQPQLCRGCETRQCLLACPYGAMFETDTGVMLSKCDLCAGRRQIGLPPACLEMCPCGAIHFAAREDIPKIETQKAREACERVMGHLRPGKAREGE